MNGDYIVNVIFEEKLEQHKLWLESLGQKGEQLVLSEKNIDMTVLSGIDLSESILLGNHFSDCKFIYSNLNYSNLGYSSFMNSDLTQVNLVKSELNHATFEHSNMLECNAFRATFIGTNFKGVDLTGARLRDVLMAEATLENTILKNADLSNACINKCRLKGVNFEGVQGIESINIDWIDVWEKGLFNRLKGDEAKLWLMNQ